MDEIHVHKTKKSICAHFAESPCISVFWFKPNHHASMQKILNLLTNIKCKIPFQFALLYFATDILILDHHCPLSIHCLNFLKKCNN